MEGLLAWAADVVAGNGSSGAPLSHPYGQEEIGGGGGGGGGGGNHDHDRDGRRRRSSSSRRQQVEEEAAQLRLRSILSAEEQEELQVLDARAASLHHRIQQLRQRQQQQECVLPMLSLLSNNTNKAASSLSLHASADSLTAALTSERNAHLHAQKEARSREASLLEENSAYGKAIISVQKQIQERVRERGQLESRSQELEKDLLSLNEKFVHIKNSTRLDHPSQWDFEENKADFQISSSVKVLMEGEELQRIRTELKMWEEKLIKLEQEWETLVQNATKLPSTVQREKDLERRLRILAEQLVSKQAQADSLTKERLLLDRQLRQASETRRQLQLSNAESDTWRQKTTGSSGLCSSSVLDANASLEWRSPQFTLIPLKMVLRRMSLAFQNARLHRNWNKQMGSQLLTNTTFRALVVAYIVSLHVIAYAVVSFSH